MIRLPISLFCSKDKWQETLANTITPFLISNQYPGGLLDGYTIEFNQSGEQIRLSLLTDELNAVTLTNKAREYFTTWFLPQTTLSEKEAPTLPHKNTTRFKLYHDKKLTIKEKQNHSVSIVVSQIILDVLKEDDIDDETIFTLAFHLQISLIKIIKVIDPEFINTLNPAVQISPSTSVDDNFILERFKQERIILHKEYEEAKQTLLEIVGDIVQPFNQPDTPEWLVLWLNICKAEIGKSEENIATVYRRIISAIYRHLGVTLPIEIFLTYSIGRVLGMMNPSNVIITGAAKCGTTTLHDTLLAHSGINGPINPYNNQPVKEVNFFSPTGNWKYGLDWYFSHFIGSKGVFLDSSPNYIISSVCFARMQEIVPDAKLIICIRDPVYRAYSHYNHFKQILPVSKDWEWVADKDFLTNIKIELNNIKLQGDYCDFDANFAGLVRRGVYINQINHLLKYYDRSQIYVSIMERWPVDHENEMSNILTFLDLKKEVLPAIIRNNREYIVEPLDNEAREILTEFYKPFNKELFDFLGFEIREWRCVRY